MEYVVCVVQEDGRLSRASAVMQTEKEAIEAKASMQYFGCRLRLMVCTFGYYMNHKL